MGRRIWIVLGLSILGCKDKESPRAAAPPSPPVGSGATAPATPPAPSPTPAPPAVSAPAAPRLAPADTAAAFDSEAEDRDWAVNTERTIKAAAPELSDIDCKRSQCRATLSATTEAELVTKTEQLGTEDGLRGTEAKHVLLTAPETVDGKLSMKIYVRFDR